MWGYVRGLTVRCGAYYAISWVLYGVLVGIGGIAEWRLQVPYATAGVATGGFFATYLVLLIPACQDLLGWWRSRKT